MKKIFLVLLPLLLLISCDLSPKETSEIVIENWCNHSVEVNVDNAKTSSSIFSESYMTITGITRGTHNITIKKAYYEMEPTKTSFTIPDDVIKMHFYIYGSPAKGYKITAMK